MSNFLYQMSNFLYIPKEIWELFGGEGTIYTGEDNTFLPDKNFIYLKLNIIDDLLKKKLIRLHASPKSENDKCYVINVCEGTQHPYIVSDFKYFTSYFKKKIIYDILMEKQ